jgi:hypothetical protein
MVMFTCNKGDGFEGMREEGVLQRNIGREG